MNMAGNEHVPSVMRKLSTNSSDEQNVYLCIEKDCGKEFKRRDRLIIHLRTHTGERPFQCEEPGCGKSYCRQPHLLRHQQNAHGVLSKMVEECDPLFICEEDGCGRTFTQEHNLQKHRRRLHSSEAAHKYKCEVEGCEETFRKHHQLRAHSFMHTNVDPYKCSHLGCVRSFKTTAHLRRHLKVHQGYWCDQEGCGLLFTKWTELRHHKSKTHVEEHVCKECNKTFPKKHLWNDHQRTHKERSPLVCTYEGCDRMYWDKRNLKAHVRRYHQEERFSCDQPACGKTFASKQKLDEHQKTHTPDYSPPVRTQRVKSKPRKKPGPKKMSAASKLSGIRDSDMDVCDELDPMVPDSSDLDCFIAPSIPECRYDTENREHMLNRQNVVQNEGMEMQVNGKNDTILQDMSIQDISPTCVSMSYCNIQALDSQVSRDTTGNESIKCVEAMNGMDSCTSESRSEFSVLQSQKIITTSAVNV